MLRSARLRVNPTTVVVLAIACSAANSSSVGVRFQFFEGKRQLVDQPRRAFRFLAVNLALELRYPQGLLHNLRRVLRRLCSRYRQLRFQRGVFFGKSGAISIHETK